MSKVYVVSIPWDSARVDQSWVFTNKKRAEDMAKRINERGYNGYSGGVRVETVDLLRGELYGQSKESDG